LYTVLVLCRALTWPFWLAFAAAGRTNDAFASIMQIACLVPTTPGILFRQSLLWWMTPRCGRRVTVHLGTIFSDRRVEFGDNVYIGAFCNIGYASIGDNVLIGSSVHLLSGKQQHLFERNDVPIALQGGRKTSIRVGHGAWIGNGSIVMADVGDECIIGAGAVVVNTIPPWSVAVGSPARVVADRRASVNDAAAAVTARRGSP
jgi:acetyltransferase-like isoleucine patch superfamily enzyme